ncbi:MAG: MgtC/SapB family protein [Xanthobacteraceae bacterium]
MIEWSEIMLRLGAATLAGGAIGLNRELNDKPIGVRTLGLVGLASALVVLVVALNDAALHVSDATSRVIQGLLTGIGFLGSGVIVQGRRHGHVHGLTSAACVWFTACIGVVCGLGYWHPVGAALVIALLLLTCGGPAEKLARRLLGAPADSGRHKADADFPDGPA